MRLALIVPFRKRWKHLYEFIPHYKRLFYDVQIYAIEQDEEKPFNRAKLLNVGYVQYCQNFDYFAAHDVDMLVSKGFKHYLIPPIEVAQLATHAQQFKYVMPFPEYLGGVTLFNNTFFERIGGYSNNFWGYGGEDNELYLRIKSLNGNIEYRDCWHQCLYHPPSHPTGVDWEKMAQAKKPRELNDGISFTKYEIIEEKPILDTAIRLKVKI